MVLTWHHQNGITMALKLTTLPPLGQGVTMTGRQTLVGFNYSLLDDQNNFRPNPDFFTSVLFKRLVGGGVLEARHEITAQHTTKLARPINDELSTRVCRVFP
eukprot:1187191-Prorocentrum_minimum.AAC.3